MRDRHLFAALLRPLRSYAERVTERADTEAIAAGLTVELLPGGVRRYRDPRLDQLAAHRARTQTVSASFVGTGTEWSSRRLITARAWLPHGVGYRGGDGDPATPSAAPAAPAPGSTAAQNTAGSAVPGGAGAVPALTVPRQGRCGFASASHATASGGP